jgi:hypothetical protein
MFVFFANELYLKLFIMIIFNFLAFLISFFFKEDILIFLLLNIINLHPEILSFLEFSSIFEIIINYIYLCFIYINILFVPFYIVFFQSYIISALYSFEKKFLYLYIYIFYIYFYINIYLFFGFLNEFIYNNLYLRFQLDPVLFNGISLDYHFNLSSYICYILEFFSIIILVYLLIICLSHIQINIITFIDNKLITLILIILVILLPPDIYIQGLLLLIVYTLINIIIFVKLILQKL